MSTAVRHGVSAIGSFIGSTFGIKDKTQDTFQNTQRSKAREAINDGLEALSIGVSGVAESGSNMASTIGDTNTQQIRHNYGEVIQLDKVVCGTHLGTGGRKDSG